MKIEDWMWGTLTNIAMPDGRVLMKLDIEVTRDNLGFWAQGAEVCVSGGGKTIEDAIEEMLVDIGLTWDVLRTDKDENLTQDGRVLRDQLWSIVGRVGP